MVAVFTGLGAGFERGSAAQLGSNGLLGSGLQGRGGDNISVNAATGNLLITRRDEYLVGKGPDVGIARTYNSLGALDENGDHWRQSTDRRVFSLAGSANSSGSSVKRVSADGSEITYAYKTINGVTAYWADDGAGAHDKLTYSGGVWTWTDGSSQVAEKYAAYGTNNWRITEQKDSDGNALTFTYSGANLTRITTKDGGYVQYQWSGNKITMVQTVADGATKTRTRYAYDSSGRLSKVTVDLSPENNSVSDGKVYETNYTYHGSTNRIASITQTDGSRIDFTYDSSGRVYDITQTPGNGEAVRLTKVRYASGNTSIYDPNNVRSILYYDGSKQLTRARLYSPGTGIDQSVYYTYDSDGNVKTVKDAEGKTTTFYYDTRGNVTRTTDQAGRNVYNVYDAKNNLTRIQRESSYTGSSNVWSYDRFVYDGENHLRYKIDAEGRVTEYTYYSAGEVNYVKEYTQHTYAVSSTIPTLAQMDAWRNGLADRTQAKIFRYLYDARGQVNRTLDYGFATSTGGSSTAEGYTDIRYTRNANGELLSRQTIGVSTETFAYDGLGRQIRATDANGGTTTITFNDAATKTTITNAVGYSVVSTYNKAGDLISTVDSGSHVAGGTDTYKYDKNGRVRTIIDGTGYKTHFIYDNLGRKTAEINHYGHITEFRYDKNGQVIATARYTNGITSANLATLDTNQNNTLTIDNLRPGAHSYDIWEWSAYDAKGRVTRTALGDGSVATYTYDHSNNLVATKSYYNKLSSSQRSALRAGTASLSSYLPSANSKDTTIRTFYDRSGRVIGVLNGEGHLSRIYYDGAGQKIQETTYANKASSSYWASGTFNQLYGSISKSSSKDITIRYIYDGQGHLRYTIDAQNYVTQFVYGGGSSARGVVRQTIQHYAKLPAQGNYKFSTVKAAVAALGSTGSNRNSWAVYNAKGQLAYAINAEGEVTRLQYDTGGRVTKTTLYAVKRSTTSLPTESTMNSWAGSNAANARVSWNFYSARGSEIRFTVDAEGYTKRFDYDKEGRLTREVRWTGKVAPTDSWTTSTINSASKGGWVDTKYGYNAAGQLINIYDANGTRRYMTYYRNGEMAWDIRAYGSGRDESRVLYVNDAAGRRYRQLNYSTDYATGQRNDIYYFYDGIGNLNKISARRSSHAYATANQDTTFTHNKNGQVLTQTNAEGGVSSFQYDAFGNVVKATDPKGSHTYMYYDQMNRQVMQVDAENYATKTSYTAFGEAYQVKRYYNKATGVGNVASQPSVSGTVATTTFYYDKLGRVKQVKDALGRSETYTLDAFGQRTRVTNKAGGYTDFKYDKRGLVIEEKVRADVHNSAGTKTSSYITTTHAYDSRGNRTQTVEASGLAEARTTTFVYDKADQLIQRKSEAVSVYTSSTDATASTVTPIEYFTYDKRGNLIESKNAIGARTLYFYDKMDRVTHVLSPTGTLTRNFYDANSNLMETRVYTSKVTLPSNALGTAPAGSGSYRRSTFVYDKLNRMTKSTVHDVQTATFGTSLSITGTGNDLNTSYQYDAVGNVIKQTDPNGKSIHSYYDKLGRKTYQVDQEGYLTQWQYDTNSNVTRERRFKAKPTGAATTSSYGTINYNWSSGDRTTDFTYDLNGNRLTETRHQVDIHNGSGGQTRSYSRITYTFNALSQVTTKTEASGDKITYTYDNQGRVKYEQRNNYVGHTGTSVTPKVQYLYNGHNELSRVYQYGAAGISAKQTKYNYDAAGRLLTKIDPAGFTKTYRYDAAGRIMREEYNRITATQGTKTEAAGYTYDLEDRITQQTIVQKSGTSWIKGTRTDMKYNAFGEVYERGINGKYAEKFDFDKAGRVWRTTSGDGTYKYLMYDNNGNQTLAITSDGTNIDNKSLASVLAYWGVTSSGGNANNINTNYVNGVAATISKYDGRNQAIEIREPEREIRSGVRYDLITKRGYNAFGEVSYEIDANNARVDYTYNAMGRRIKVQSPTVSITGTNGTKTNVRPTENYYYDRSGRLIAQRDANNNLTRLALLAGTGYNGSEALVRITTAADGTSVKTDYDIFGNARKVTDQLNRVTTHSFDNMGRVTQTNHSGGKVDYFQYDGLGQNIKKWNNQFGSGNAEQIDYDQQGRVIRQRAIGGDVTSYAYSWSSSYATSGLGTFGGWNQVTTYANGRTLTERTDLFGRDIYRNDLGGRYTNYTYDKAGRQTGRSGTGTESQTFTYLNTGRIHQAWGQTGTTASQNWTRLTATYQYDKVGNLTKESLAQTGQYTYDYYEYEDYGYGGFVETIVVNTNSTLKNATATYDALGRLKTWNETGNSITPVASRSFEYDANGNIRRSRSVFRKLDAQGNASTVNSVDDHWYRYDSLNRVVTSKGVLSGGTVQRGTKGTDIFYDNAGQRVYTLQSFQDTYTYVDYEDFEFEYYGGGPSTVTINFTNTRREDYVYDSAGRVTQIKSAKGSYNQLSGTGTVPSGPGTIRSRLYYDTIGRQTRQIDYLSNGSTVAYDNSKVYNTKSQITSETTTTRRGSKTYKTYSTYSYGSGSSYALGAATYIHTTVYKENSTYSVDYYSSTTNNYTWYNGAVQASTLYKPKTNESRTNTTTYFYSAGGFLQKASISDGRSRTVTFTNDQNGQVIRRDERDGKYTTGDPHEVWYRFGGKEMGYVGNNGTLNTDHEKSITNRTATQGQGAFRNGSTYGSSYSDFDQSYAAINSFSQGSQNGTYTIQAGDTLQGIAANLWGDASLWYKLAQVNGMTGENQLIEGQSLVVPTGVTRSTNNASTFKPYNPGETIGDLNPTTPEPPKAAKKKKCGVLGAILLVVVAVVVTIATAGAAAGALGTVGGGVFGGIGTAFTGGIGALGLGTGVTGIAVGAASAAVGSIVSQAVGVATGIQDKFSWKSVGLAAISGGLGVSGIADIANTGNAVVNGAINGATSSMITQGIGVVTGLQDKFSWAGVAAAGVSGAVSSGIGKWAGEKGHSIAKGIGLTGDAEMKVAAAIGATIVSGASALANAATRSAIDGTNFGDAIIASIPDVVGSAIRAYSGACFVGDTMVRTPTGLRRIDSIKVGDWVFARDENFVENEVQPKRVIELYRFENRSTLDVTIEFEDGSASTLRTTPEHPFAVEEQFDTMDGQNISAIIDGGVIEHTKVLAWYAAKDLMIGTRVINIDGRIGLVTDISHVGILSTVHNFAVEDFHTYFVGKIGVWVHNEYSARHIAKLLTAKLTATKTHVWFTRGTETLHMDEVSDTDAVSLAGAELALLGFRDEEMYGQVWDILIADGLGEAAGRAEQGFHNAFARALGKITEGTEFTGATFDTEVTYEGAVRNSIKNGKFSARKFAGIVAAMGQGKKGFAANADLASASLGHLLTDNSMSASNVLDVINSINSPSLSDWIHGVLGVAGFIPVIGIVADLADAGLYAYEGKAGMAALSAAAAVPFVGDAAAAGRLGLKAARFMDNLSAASSAVGRALLAARACFASGTLVMTKGGHKPIEDIEVGDMVWSRSEHDTDNAGWRKVIESGCTGEQEIYEIAVSSKDGARTEIFRTTETHPFWSEKGGVKGEGGFVAAADLPIGAPLRLHNGAPAFVMSVTRTGKVESVFNFSVEGFHTYHVGELGVWVHNVCLKAAMLAKGLLKPGEAAHHIARNSMKHSGLKKLFSDIGLDVNDVSNGVGLRFHSGGIGNGIERVGGHQLKKYDELVYQRLKRFAGDETAIKSELATIAGEMRAIDNAGRYAGWKPYASEKSFNTVNEWVRRNASN